MLRLEPLPPLPRRIFCNRTLNLRSIGAIGFDMDYTLIHYRTRIWEQRAYEYTKQRLSDHGFPVAGLDFDPQGVTLGLVIDRKLGNLVKANRFGYVKRAAHGTRMLAFEEQRRAYSQVLVDLEEPRWAFVNTLFGLSEAWLYSQLVDLLDAGKIGKVLGYTDLYDTVRKNVDETHMEGALKAEIIANPDTFLEPDGDLPLALLDLKHAGKKLLLITNSEWRYTAAMMAHAFNKFLPSGTEWRDLFALVIVGARKPSFFTQDNPIFEVVDDSGLLRPHVGRLREGGAYLGGSAARVERHLGLSGDDLLYVGDHIYADVHVSQRLLRWRTALVVRELEQDLAAIESFDKDRRYLDEMMGQKELLEHNFSLRRVALQRVEKAYGPPPKESVEEERAIIQELRAKLAEIDQEVGPLARRAAELVNPRWGLLLRAGNDKSHLARQIERYADAYTSRVSNFLWQTPFVYMRSPGGSLPHDDGIADAHAIK